MILCQIKIKLTRTIINSIRDFTKEIYILKDIQFSYMEAWFTGQNSKPLEIKDKIDITLVIH